MITERSLNALEYPRVLQHLAQQCVSAGAKAHSLALVPYDSLDDVHQHAQLFDEAYTWFSRSGFVLTTFPEIADIVRYVASPHALLETEVLWELKQFLLAVQQVISHMETQPMDDAPLLSTLWHAHELPRNTMLALNRCLDANGQLTDGSSPELLLIRGELRRLHQSCLRKVKEYTAQYNISHYLQDEFMSLASDRYVLPLKVSYKTKLQGIIHDYSQTGETCYFEPMFLVELNNTLQSLKHEEREEERKVLQYLTDLVRDDSEQLTHLEAVLVQLDLLQAKARLARIFDGRCVSITPLAENDTLSLLGARHPLMVLGNDDAHAVDLILRKGERALIISGGNAGGKTVCLKTLGLIAVMSLAALPVPVRRGSQIPAWTQVHAFIGDEQSLDDHVSTFTAQIRALAQAWTQCDDHSLVLLDEFGSGTDPAQGAALAQAVLDELLEKSAYILAATHFPALKTYALSHEHVRAASVLFDPRTKKPLFTLAYDQVGASQALDVAREHGLADAVLRRAEQYLLLEGHDMTRLMDRLNALAAEREQENTLLRQEQEKTREKRQRMQEQLDRERGKLVDELRAHSAAILARFKEGRSSPKTALKEMAQLRASLSKVELEKKEAPGLDIAMLQPGSRVLHSQLGKIGTVLEVDTRRSAVRVDVNGLTVWAPVTVLASAASAKAAPAPRPVQHRPAAGFLPLRLDVRGMRAELALEELAQFLDKALLSGRDSIEIVHGRGTGILRKQIHSALRAAAHVGSFCTAPEDQGGDGVTLVEFR